MGVSRQEKPEPIFPDTLPINLHFGFEAVEFGHEARCFDDFGVGRDLWLQEPPSYRGQLVEKCPTHRFMVG
jgi:hypothetical protein